MKVSSMRHCALAISTFVTVLLTGCGASGPAFKPIDAPTDGRGVVYIYRQSSGLGAGVHGTVRANSTPVTDMKNGGYFPYVGTPGPVKFEVTTEATNDATVNLEAGIEKFLKVTVGMGFFVGHLHLTEVSPEIGKKEIADTKLLEPAKP